MSAAGAPCIRLTGSLQTYVPEGGKYCGGIPQRPGRDGYAPWRDSRPGERMAKQCVFQVYELIGGAKMVLAPSIRTRRPETRAASEKVAKPQSKASGKPDTGVMGAAKPTDAPAAGPKLTMGRKSPRPSPRRKVNHGARRSRCLGGSASLSYLPAAHLGRQAS